MVAAFDYSVVIPVYNGEAFLARALASVSRQAVAPREIIVIDDGSVDRSREIASEHDVTLIEAPHGGVSRARNLGIEASTSEWIAFLDCDDIWTPGHITDLADAATRDTDLVTSPHVYYDGSVVGNASGTQIRVDTATILCRFLGISASGTAARRVRLHEVGNFDESLTHCEDLDLWLRVLGNGSAVSTARPSVLSDLHEGHASLQPGAMRRGLLAVLDRAVARAAIDDKMRRRVVIIAAHDDLRSALRQLAGRQDVTSSVRSAARHLGTIAANPILAVTTLTELLRHRKQSRLLAVSLGQALDGERRVAGMSSIAA